MARLEADRVADAEAAKAERIAEIEAVKQAEIEERLRYKQEQKDTREAYTKAKRKAAAQAALGAGPGGTVTAGGLLGALHLREDKTLVKTAGNLVAVNADGGGRIARANAKISKKEEANAARCECSQPSTRMHWCVSAVISDRLPVVSLVPPLPKRPILPGR